MTGLRASLAAGIEDLVGRIRAHTDLPVCAGIGVSNAEQAAAVARFADGVIVGTALVHRLADAGLAGLHTLTTDLATAVHTARPWTRGDPPDLPGRPAVGQFQVQAELGGQEGQDVGVELDGAADRAGAVAGLALAAEQDRAVGDGGGLEGGAHLAGVERVHPGVGVEDGEQHRRVGVPSTTL